MRLRFLRLAGERQDQPAGVDEVDIAVERKDKRQMDGLVDREPDFGQRLVVREMANADEQCRRLRAIEA
jgi:hypothetical protein